MVDLTLNKFFSCLSHLLVFDFVVDANTTGLTSVNPNQVKMKLRPLGPQFEVKPKQQKFYIDINFAAETGVSELASFCHLQCDGRG